MPIHDWTKAPSGYFHHFHQNWTVGICAALNTGILPKGVFALVEQYSGALVPDVLALETDQNDRDWFRSGGGLALATEPPKTRFLSRENQEIGLAEKANIVSVRRNDEKIAIIEIVSPGNKASQNALDQFVKESLELLHRGINLLIIDLFPPTRRDPQGIHPAIWSSFNSEPFALPTGQPQNIARADGFDIRGFQVPRDVGRKRQPSMPLFLNTQGYIRVPLEETYGATWNACPAEFKQRVTGGA